MIPAAITPVPTSRRRLRAWYGIDPVDPVGWATGALVASGTVAVLTGPLWAAGLLGLAAVGARWALAARSFDGSLSEEALALVVAARQA